MGHLRLLGAELEFLSATLLRFSGACGPLEAEQFTYEERHRQHLVGEAERRPQRPAVGVGVRQTRLGVVLQILLASVFIFLWNLGKKCFHTRSSGSCWRGRWWCAQGAWRWSCNFLSID